VRQSIFVRPAIFHPKARQVIRTFPKSARRALGEAILDLQFGRRLGMPLSRPMAAVAAGVCELRVRDSAGIYRAFYLIRSAQGVLVFHAFQKKTQKTPRAEIELAAKRLKEMTHGED
jgi:phage-related protein